MNEELISRFPYELSGGEQQRVVIARALATNPCFLIADEPTSSLDAVHKRQIIELLKDLQGRLGLTMLLISHDLAIVSHIADRIGVMYQGKLVEVAPIDCLFKSPAHPYSKILLKSVLCGAWEQFQTFYLKREAPDGVTSSRHYSIWNLRWVVGMNGV